MAAPDKKPAAKPAAGKPAKKGGGKSRGSLYENGKAKNRSCPKCGPGFFMGIHKDRIVCGKCNYTEMIVKK